MRATRRRAHGILLLLLALSAGCLDSSGTAEAPARDAPPRNDEPLVEQAFRDGRSDLWVEVGGTVRRILPDDLEGSRHQRFILELSGGHTLLISHNIDLAPRVPLVVGDTLRLRGEYEWNDRGGVVHWTHHDPRGNHAGGWIEHRGETYR